MWESLKRARTGRHTNKPRRQLTRFGQRREERGTVALFPLCPQKEQRENNMKKTRSVCYYKDLWKWTGATMALPGILLIVVFIIVPFFMNVGYAFTDYCMTFDIKAE